MPGNIVHITDPETVRSLFGIYPATITYSGTEVVNNKVCKVYEAEYAGEVPTVCPRCGQKLYSHGYRMMQVADTPNGGKPVLIKLAMPRRRCRNPDCHYMWQASYEDITADRKLTKRAEHAIIEQCIRNTFEEVSRNYPLTSTSIVNIFTDFFRSHPEVLHFKIPEYMGIDEIKVNGDFITVITDLEHHTMFNLLEKRTQPFLEVYFANLPLAERQRVKWVCSDMYRPFSRPISTYLPNARWAIDHFHVVMKANGAVDSIRRKLQSKYPGKTGPHFKHGPAAALRRRLPDLTADDAAGIRWLRSDPDLSPLATAYDLKEDFFNIYDENTTSKEDAEAAFTAWENSLPPEPEKDENGNPVSEDLFKPFRDLAATVHNFYEEIFAVWDCDIAISNGFTECSNRLIRETHLKGRGYSFERLRAKTLLRNANVEAILENDSAFDYVGPALSENNLSNLVFSGTGNDGYDLTNDAYPDLGTSEDAPDYDPETGEVLSLNDNEETF